MVSEPLIMTLSLSLSPRIQWGYWDLITWAFSHRFTSQGTPHVIYGTAVSQSDRIDRDGVSSWLDFRLGAYTCYISSRGRQPLRRWWDTSTPTPPVHVCGMCGMCVCVFNKIQHIYIYIYYPSIITPLYIYIYREREIYLGDNSVCTRDAFIAAVTRAIRVVHSTQTITLPITALQFYIYTSHTTDIYIYYFNFF